MASGLLPEGEDRGDRVEDVGEAARLRAVSEHGQVVLGEGLADEVRDDHAVGAGLPWAHRVEEPHHDHLGVLLARVAVGDHLAEDLGRRIRPAALLGAPEEAIRLLGEGAHAVLAVDLRSGGVEEADAVSGGRLGDDVAAAHVLEERFERALADQLHPDRGGEMKAPIDLPHQPVDLRRVVGRALDKRGAAIEQVLDVSQVPGREIVQDHDLVAALHERVGEVAPNESCAPGDQIANDFPPRNRLSVTPKSPA